MFFLIFPAAFRGLLLLLLFLVHLQSKFVLEWLYKVRLLLKIVLSIGVILSEANTTKNWLVELRSTLTEYLETENFRLIMINFRRKDHCRREMLQKDLGEVTTEEASIKIYVSTSWWKVSVRHIRIFAAWAKYLNSASSRVVCHS